MATQRVIRTDNDKALREHLLFVLKGDGAHVEFEVAVKNMPSELRDKKPQGAEHSPWEVLEHLRIAQRNVLEAIRDPNHVSPEFPAGYWPKSATPASEAAWDESVAGFEADFAALVDLVADSQDLLAALPNGDGQTIMRKVLMAADHSSYHLGELVLLRRVLGAWE